MGTIFDNLGANVDLSIFKKDNNDPKTPIRRHYLSLVGLLQYVDIINGDLTGQELPEGVTEDTVKGMAYHCIGDLDTREAMLGGGPGPEPTPVEPVDPPKTENTEEQNATEEAINEAFNEGTKTYTAPEGTTINNVTIPADSGLTGSATINGEFQDGAHIVMEANQSLTINHTGEEPVSVHIEMPAGKSATLKGNYEDVYVEGKTASWSNATISGTVTIVAPEGTTGQLNVGGDWVGENCAIYTEYDGTLNVINSNPTGDEKINVYAPNATVTLNNKFDEVEAATADETLKLAASFHANKLKVTKGTLYLGCVEGDESMFFDELVLEGNAKVVYATTEITATKLDGLTGSNLFAGKAIVMEDIELTNKNMGLGILASGKEVLDLNGHSVAMGRTDTACMYLRGTAKLNIIDSVGGGKLINNSESYGIWTGAEGNVVTIYGGQFEAYTHVMYAYLGEIDIYGGTFKMLGENADIDEKGHYKFLLNCYDANYTAGTARIKVYGGKYYNFDPADAYGEPGAPISYVAEGYKSVKSIEDGVEVFTVVPNDQPDPNE